MSALGLAMQERFCHEYVKDLDGKAALLRAGYSAECNMGRALKVHELGDEEATALSGFEPSGEAGKVVDRLKVLELLGRHFGLWPRKPAPPQDVNLFEGMSLDEIRRVRDRDGQLLGGAGVDLPGSAPPRRAR